jgi:hypothetical protein
VAIAGGNVDVTLSRCRVANNGSAGVLVSSLSCRCEQVLADVVHDLMHHTFSVSISKCLIAHNVSAGVAIEAPVVARPRRDSLRNVRRVHRACVRWRDVVSNVDVESNLSSRACGCERRQRRWHRTGVCGACARLYVNKQTQRDDERTRVDVVDSIVIGGNVSAIDARRCALTVSRAALTGGQLCVNVFARVRVSARAGRHVLDCRVGFDRPR